MRRRGAEAGWEVLLAMAEAEVADVTRGLPEDVAELASEVPVVFDEAPSTELVADGLDPDLLGLFVGIDYASGESGVQAEGPTQIHLYLTNIWDYAGRDRSVFREEVRITYLHELGHFLGLDEADLADREID